MSLPSEPTPNPATTAAAASTEPFAPVASGGGSQGRSRLALAAIGLGMALSVLLFQHWSRDLSGTIERKARAGDFPFKQVALGRGTVDHNGRIEGEVVDRRQTIFTVASLKVVPPGAYEAWLVARDGNAKHEAKTLVVIGARDASGAWHPDTAAALADAAGSPEALPPLGDR